MKIEHYGFIESKIKSMSKPFLRPVSYLYPKGESPALLSYDLISIQPADLARFNNELFTKVYKDNPYTKFDLEFKSGDTIWTLHGCWTNCTMWLSGRNITVEHVSQRKNTDESVQEAA